MVQLVHRRGASAPDRAQFEAIYLGHHAFVGRCLARLGVPPAGVDDARQDVFLTAFRRLHSYAGQASMRAWLAGIARRVAWRHRRTRARHQRKVDALAAVRVEPSSLDAWIRTREAQAVLDAFIEALDPPKREAFVLCELEGFSAREAASATGVNAATLYSRLRVARSSFASMCQTLEQDGIAVEPRHAAAIHRTAHREEPRAATRGWVLLVPKLTSGALLAKPLLLAALGLGTLGVGTAAYAVRTDRGPRDELAPVLASIEAVPSDTIQPEPAPAPASPMPAPTPNHSPVPAPAVKRGEAPLDPLPAMVEQLGDAERRLRARDWPGAARSAETHLTRWPDGPLARDAVAVAVQARCELGERARALALAQAHLASNDVESYVERRCAKSTPPVMKPKAAGD